MLQEGTCRADACDRLGRNTAVLEPCNSRPRRLHWISRAHASYAANVQLAPLEPSDEMPTFSRCVSIAGSTPTPGHRRGVHLTVNAAGVS